MLILLPPELVRMILMMLRKKDLCSAALVCKKMKNIALDPALWNKLTVHLPPNDWAVNEMPISRRTLLKDGFAGLFSCPRFKKVKSVDLSCTNLDPADLTTFFEKVSETETVNTLILGECDLRKLDPDLLASAIAGLDNIDLECAKLTKLQTRKIILQLTKSTKLTKISLLRLKHVKSVSPELLSSAIVKVSSANLSNCNLDSNQITAILKKSLESNIITDLNLACNKMGDICPKLLSEAGSKLTHLNLNATEVKCQKLIQRSLESGTLQNLQLLNNNLEDIPSNVLVAFASNQKQIDLCRTNLTSEQVTLLLRKSLSFTNLTALRLSCVDLSKVPANLFAKSVARYKEVNLASTKLRTNQIVAFLEQSLLRDSPMDVLSLEFNSLKDIPEKLLAQAVCRLKHAYLQRTHLTTSQSVAILQMNLENKTPADVDMSENDLSDVPKDLMISTASKIPYFNFRDTLLNDSDFFLYLFHALVNVSSPSLLLSTYTVELDIKSRFSMPTWLDFDLSYTDLSFIPPDTFAKAVNRFETTRLRFCSLTAPQITTFLEESLQSNCLTNLNLSGNDFNDISQSLMAKAIVRFKRVTLRFCDLSTYQVMELVDQKQDSDALDFLDIRNNRLVKILKTELEMYKCGYLHF